MKITVSSKPGSDAVAVRFFTTEQRAELPRGITEAELSLQPQSRVFLHAENTLCVGIGERDAVDGDGIRRAAGTAVLALKKSGRMLANLHIEAWPKFVGEAVEGVLLADYRHVDFKPVKPPVMERVNVIVQSAALATARHAAERAMVLGEMTNLARKVANQPGNIVFPASFAEQAQWHAKMYGLHCDVLDERRLKAGKFGGILAVGCGSKRGPRLVVLEHRKGPKGQAPLVLIGKAVTFDTGGISIKPAADMERMIWDKCGGTAVLGAMLAIARLGVRRNVIGLIPAAENMPGPAAFRPGDIVKCYDGKTVEIINTDAEGRMLLADAIGFARLHYRAGRIVDVATLTGACAVALGEAAAGLWTNDDAMRDRMLAAGVRAGERAWPMPLFGEYDDSIRSEVALVKNSGGRLGGACTAAAFLKTFAENTPWAHLDIAAVAQTAKEHAWLARGATGYGVRTLVHLVEAST